MEIITFEEWKKECGDDKTLAQKYQANHFDGINQFVITFETFAESKLQESVFKGANCFIIRDENNQDTKDFDIIDDDYNKFEFFGGTRLPTPEDNGLNKEDVNRKIKNKDNSYNVQGFYTLLLVFCIKNDVLDDSDIKDLSKKSGTNLYLKIKNRNITIPTGVNVDDLFTRSIEWIKKLINKFEKYKKYKIIFTPNKNTKKNYTDNNNGGTKSMNENYNKEGVKIDKLIAEKINAHKQIIFTGAPGTGKTFSVREYVKMATQNDESRYKFVQFHSSYDYTDFVEGIRPVPKGENGENIFVRMDGTFKAFCRRIADANLKIIKETHNDIKSIDDLYNKMKESDKDTEETDTQRNAIKDTINGLPMYYFVIDEINRADLSKVFGELMFGLEEDYRGVQNRFPTQYHNLPTYEMKEDIAYKITDDCFKNGFFVPENLTIIGTMNDIDRSVETFDFALRRRFAWVEIKANEVMLYSVASINNKSKDEVEDIVKKIQDMNEIISGEGKKLGLNESYHIGPAYFKNLFDSNGNDNRETIFNEKIKPLLKEYTRGKDSEKVEALISGCKNALFDKSKTTDTSGGNNG